MQPGKALCLCTGLVSVAAYRDQSQPWPADTSELPSTLTSLLPCFVFYPEEFLQEEVRQSLAVVSQNGMLLDQVIENGPAAKILERSQVHSHRRGAFRAVPP